MAASHPIPEFSSGTTCDFHAVAARARADNPDAVLFDALEAEREINQRMRRARGDDAQLRRVALDGAASMRRIIETRPATLNGLLAKLRHAAEESRGRPIHSVQHSALLDALAWLEPPKPPKRGRSAAKGKGDAK